MRALQYVRDGGVRLVILPDGEKRDAVDVGDSPRFEGTDLVPAIRAARFQERRFADFLGELLDEGGRKVEVDLEKGVVDGPDGRWSISLPVLAPEVWAAGVTYLRSREARESESKLDRDVYSRIYEAERPELFLKDAASRRTVPTEEAICIRLDSSWTVPEAEIGLILNEHGETVGYTIGNDVCARDLEAENPLYLPQAKTYRSSCSMGPAVFVPETVEQASEFQIYLRLTSSDGRALLEETTSTAEMKRAFSDLSSFLLRSNLIEDGTVLLTGTGIVPPDDVSLQPGWVVEISVPQIGTLRNPVRMADA